MPASAHHPTACPDDVPAEGARVIDFTSRVRRKGAPAAPAPQEAAMEIGPAEEKVARAWEKAMARHELSMTDPVVAAATRACAEMLERLVHGARAIREGDPEAGVPGSPDSGMEALSAELMLNLLAEMRRASEHVTALRPDVQEL